MKYLVPISFALAFTAGLLSAQETVIRAKVTYIAGDLVYIAPGRDMGIADSNKAYLLSGKDTLAILKVFATSSKTAACSVLKSKRQIVLGDVIIVISQTRIPQQQPVAMIAAAKDSSSNRPVDTALTIKKPEKKSLLSLQGRVNIRYITTRPSASATTITQPGISLNIRGRFNELPLQFTVLGNFRSLIYGSSSPLRSASDNQTRIYRLSIDFDDGENILSIGRVNPSFASSAGYIDGAVLARRFGDIVLGGAAGFEPTFSQRGISSDFKKFVLFTGYQPSQGSSYSANLAYVRTVFQTQLDREVVSAWMSMFPSQALYLFAQSDVDLRTKKNDELISKAKLTNLFANINYRFTTFFTLGAGVTAWRPSYSYSVVRALPDSLIDSKLRTNPTVNINFYFSPGISLYNTYSPRTSEEGFGKEYSNYSSIGFSNVLGQGISVRGTVNINKSLQTNINGYGASVQKNLTSIVDLTLRYQFNSYTFVTSDLTRTSKTFAVDFLVPIVSSLSCWGSIERFIGLDANTTTLSMDVSWIF